MGGVHQAHEVDVDHALPVVQVRAGGGAEQHEAGVVDQRVQTAQALDGPLDRFRGGLRGGDVGGHDQGLAAGAGDFRGEVGEPVLAPTDQGHGGALASKLQRGGVADAAGRSGDQGDGSFKTTIHGFKPFDERPRRCGPCGTEGGRPCGWGRTGAEAARSRAEGTMGK